MELILVLLNNICRHHLFLLSPSSPPCVSVRVKVVRMVASVGSKVSIVARLRIRIVVVRLKVAVGGVKVVPVW